MGAVGCIRAQDNMMVRRPAALRWCRLVLLSLLWAWWDVPAAAAAGLDPPAIMPHLLFPSKGTYPPEYNLSRATAIQT